MQTRGFRLPGANYQVNALDVCKSYAGRAGSATQRPGYRKGFGGCLLRPPLWGDAPTLRTRARPAAQRPS